MSSQNFHERVVYGEADKHVIHMHVQWNLRLDKDRQQCMQISVPSIAVKASRIM